MEWLPFSHFSDVAAPEASCGSIVGSRKNQELSLPRQLAARDTVVPRCPPSRPAAQSRAMDLLPGAPRNCAEVATDGATLSGVEYAA